MNQVDAPRSALNRALNLLGVVVVGSAFLTRSPALWMIPYLIGLLAWAAVSLLPRSTDRIVAVLLFVMAVAGSLSTVGSNGVGVVLVAVAVLQLSGSLARPPCLGITAGMVSIALIAIPALLVSFPPFGLLSVEFGVLLAMLGGFTRRQQRIAEAQTRALLDERATIREEQARAELLAQRQAVSRDIHDVLAHSLGGLVIQLDAVEALLEAGRVPDASSRVHAARELAVSGLTEARRAVQALRDDPVTSTEQLSPRHDDDLAVVVDDLVEAHRALGGDVTVSQSGTPHPLAAEATVALSRVLQEALTNARKHAPSREVLVELSWRSTTVTLLIVNTLAADASPVAATGGGHGLPGMAERIAALPNATFSAAERDGTFEIRVVVGPDS